MQRILETSRKLGLPVIVTDVAGREPMVVLPLEQFEAMAGAGSEPVAAPAARDQAEAENRSYTTNRSNRTYSPAGGAQPQAADATYEAALGVLERHAEQSLQNASKKDEKTDEELPMEDRFYIEPLDDVAGA